ncbi:MAG: DNA-binding protein [Neisseriales bacterium]|nr:MAG: DNA-binding protein [Neisseriales bacterium]
MSIEILKSMSQKEAAIYLKICPNTIRKIERCGNFPPRHYVTPSLFYYDKQELDKWFASGGIKQYGDLDENK